MGVLFSRGSLSLKGVHGRCTFYKRGYIVGVLSLKGVHGRSMVGALSLKGVHGRCTVFKGGPW